MEQIGRYRIVSELGRGAMGIVYRAHDPKIDREVALKTIQLVAHAGPSEISDMRGRLIREARSAGRLSHPGIVTIYDAGEQEGLAYVAMELVEGRSLADILAGPVVPDRKLEFLVAFLKKAGSALDYASANGVVHRDVKPANIMVSGGNVKLLDFGVARITSSQTTRAGAVFGTPNYISPEQVQGLAVDGRADQFSLGVIAYEILCGVKPFEGEALATTLYKIVHDEPEPLRAYLPDMHPGLETVVLRALRKSPQDRFASCEDFARAFEDAAKGQAALDPAISAPQDLGDDDVDSTLDIRADPGADPEDRTNPGADGLGAGAMDLSLPERAPAKQPPADAGLARPGRAAGEPLLPVGGASAGAGEPAAEPKQRWPNLIFALLILAIGALALLLVRYPGLLENPRALLDAILGVAPAAREAPSTRQVAPTKPAAGPSDPAGSQAGSGLASRTGMAADAAPAADGPEDMPAAGPDGSGSSSGGRQGNQRTSPAAGAAPAAGDGAPQGGSAFFRSPVDGVVVTVDGNRDWQCVTPCRLAGLPLGERELLARRDGYSDLRRTVRISAAALTVNLPLERVGATLLVSSDPAQSRILLDGRDTGLTTNARLTVSPGKHAIRVVSGARAAERTIEVADRETRHLRFRLGTPQ